ncbi:MAG: hypothetical protein ACJ79H_18320 [Myxococcales bacterium]
MRSVLAALCAGFFAGCTFGTDVHRTDGASAVIGPSGGMLAMAGGAALEIPAGALAKDTTITIAQVSEQSSGGALSPVYEFGPDGTTFSKPVTVTFTVPSGTGAGSVYWTAPQGAAYEELPTIIQGTTAVAQISHFSRGFVGPPCGTRSAIAVCGERRDVTGAFAKIFWTDDGRKSRVNTPQPGVTISALVPTAGRGYQRFAGVFAPDGSSFTIHAVPAGRYFLEIEGMARREGAVLYEFTTSTPDLSSVVAYRQDLARTANPTPVTLNVSNLDPWTPGNTLTGDQFEVASSQANLSLRPWFRGGPAAGSTSFDGTVDWRDVLSVVPGNPVAGLPDASKGDVLWFYQASHRTLGTGPAAAVYRPATKAARVSTVTLRDGVAATIDVPLAPVPQTGSMTADVRYTQFAALTPDVGPSATTHQFSFDVFAVPHGTHFPDMPQDSPVVRPLLLAYDFTAGSTSLPDTSYGTVAYGQFGDSQLWQEYRQTLYFYDVPFSARGSAAESLTAFAAAQEPMSSAPIEPALGPVRAPQVNGRSLFQPQNGVGTQPTISWSAPVLGAATSVVVNIVALDGSTALEATVRSESSFTMPPGVLTPGRPYVAILTARQAPWDGADAPPFRFGLPFYSTDCITSTFTP